MDTKPSSTKSVERLSSSPKTEVKFDQRLILSAARGQDFRWIDPLAFVRPLLDRGAVGDSGREE
jgi:hypothetical protein